MARTRISTDQGMAALEQALDGGEHARGSQIPAPGSPKHIPGSPSSRDALAVAVRYTLQLLAETAPGKAVEVRVPPFGVVQCVAGPRHSRGTPANVVETDAATWLALATGRLDWDTARTDGRIRASGVRASLDAVLPLLPSGD